MSPTAEKRRVAKIQSELQEVFDEAGVDMGFPPHPRHVRAIRKNNPTLYLWTIIRGLVRFIQSQNTLTAEDLEAVEGVGPQTAQRIVDSIQ